MKIRALICIWLVVLLGLATCGAGLPDIGLSSNQGRYSLGLKTALQNGGGGAVDTIRVMSRHSTYPNTGAIAADYFNAADTTGVLNSAADGTTVRWGWVRQNQATTVQCATTANADYENWIRPFGNSSEDNYTLDGNHRVGLLWFSANGLKHGQKVESASVLVNVVAGGITVSAGTYFAAYLDTIAKDYRILNNNTANGTHGTNNDVARFDCSFNHLDVQNSIAWEPLLTERLDWHDWGPRSNNSIPPGTYAAGTPLRFDVTDAVQQWLDNPRSDLSKGLLFAFGGYQGGTTSYGVAAGNYAASVAAAKGNPLFYATVTTKRGAKPWGMNGTPIALVWDGEYPYQTNYADALIDSGLDMTAFLVGYNMDASAPVYDWPDSLETLRPNDFHIVNLSKTINSLGSLTGGPLDAELSREWFIDAFDDYATTYGAPIDTSAIVDHAWIGGTGTPYWSIEAASRMMDFGYRSARGGGIEWAATAPAMSHHPRMSWLGPVHRYLFFTVALENITETGAGAATDAEVLERLTDYIDNWYTKYGRATLILHGHNYDTDHLDGDALRKFIGLTRSLGSCEIVNYHDMVSARLAGATYLAPGAITEWVSAGTYTQVMRGICADSNQIQAMAAQQDSVYEATSNANLLQMWVGPK